MAITSHATLIEAVRDWLARPTDTVLLTDARIGDAIAFGESDIYAVLRVRAMEVAVDLTIDTQTEALPTDFIEARRLYLDGQDRQTLEYVVPSQFWAAYSTTYTGRPRHFTLEAGSLAFGPAPDATYTGKFLYYARPAALSSATNAIFTANPDLYLYAALRHMAPFTGAEDVPRMAVLDQMFGAALARVQGQSSREMGDMPLMIRAG